MVIVVGSSAEGGLKNVMLTQEERGVKRGCEKKKKVDDGTRDVLF